MGAYSPEQTLIFIAAAVVAAVLLLALLIRRLRSRKPAAGQQARAPAHAPAEPRPVAPAAQPRKPADDLAAPPVRVAVPHPAPARTFEPSYAAVAAAHANAHSRQTPAAPVAPAIDYTDALTGIAPNASYTAAAIAAAIGVTAATRESVPPTAPAQSRPAGYRNGAPAESYAAIAAALTANAAPAPHAPHAFALIDYSGETTDVPPGASYAAVAVAHAARAR